MTDDSTVERATELLQQFGLKEYEAKCFVALSRLPSGTAKEISEVSTVPRTRVYDATRVLESKGLVEVQHTNPQRFRAVGVDEAVDLLRNEYESRASTLRATLDGLAPAGTDDGQDVTHEVWALSGGESITSRATKLVDDAVSEAVLVVGDESVLDDSLIDRLTTASGRGVTVVVGATTEAIRDRVADALPGAATFVSGLEWLAGAGSDGDATRISRLLLVDRSAILVSTFHAGPDDGRSDERAVFGRGFDNGLVTIARRLMATGLLPVDDPGTGAGVGDSSESPTTIADAPDAGVRVESSDGGRDDDGEHDAGATRADDVDEVAAGADPAEPATSADPAESGITADANLGAGGDADEGDDADADEGDDDVSPEADGDADDANPGTDADADDGDADDADADDA